MDTIQSWSLPLGTDIALAELLIYLNDQKKLVVQYRSEDSSCCWNNEIIEWTEQSFYCWHDTCIVNNTVPIVLPVAYDDRRQRFAAFGRFCSFACALKFVFVRQGFYTNYGTMLLRLMANKLFGYAVDHIFNAAPARESLNIFGNYGPASMDIEVFRKSTKTTQFRKPPFLTPASIYKPAIFHNHDDNSNSNNNIDYLNILLYQSWSTGYVIISSFTNTIYHTIEFPRNSSVCWFDTEPFGTKPIGCPLSSLKHGGLSIIPIVPYLDTNDLTTKTFLKHFDFDYSNPFKLEQDEEIYFVYGSFCSFECMLGYLLEIRDWCNDIQMILVHKMAHDIYGIPDNILLEPACPVWELRKFGGTLSIEEFRASFHFDHRAAANNHSNFERVLWISTGIEYHSDILPNQFTSLRNQTISSASIVPKRNQPNISEHEQLLQKLQSRSLYAQYIEQRRKELGSNQQQQQLVSGSSKEKTNNMLNRKSKLNNNNSSGSCSNNRAPIENNTGCESLLPFIRKTKPRK